MTVKEKCKMFVQNVEGGKPVKIGTSSMEAGDR